MCDAWTVGVLMTFARGFEFRVCLRIRAGRSSAVDCCGCGGWFPLVDSELGTSTAARAVCLSECIMDEDDDAGGGWV